MNPLHDYLQAMRERDGTIESTQNLDTLWHAMSAEERQQAHRELQMRPGEYDARSTWIELGEKA